MTKEPDFNQFLKALKGEKTDRPQLFEFIINDSILEHFAGKEISEKNDDLRQLRIGMHAFVNAGYNFAVIPPWHADFMQFKTAEHDSKASYSLNDSVLITDQDSFEKYDWPDPENYDYDIISRLGKEMPDGLKLLGCGYGGILETAIALTGFENLCIMTLMEEDFTLAIFEEIGKRLYRYYDIVSDYEEVGAIIHPDDWGFKTQPMLPPDLMEKYVYPWHKRIANMIHQKDKPVLLHSCGNPEQVIDAVIDHIGYDGRHSYEDTIVPVEEAYERWHERIAVLGGIDVDFLSRSTPEAIYQRAMKLIEQTQDRGHYALGSGNSIPDFVSLENYQAMLKAVEDF